MDQPNGKPNGRVCDTTPPAIAASLAAAADRLGDCMGLPPARGEKNLLVDRLRKDLGPRYSPARCSLGSYAVKHPAQRDVVQRLSVLLHNLGEFVASGRGLIFYGSIGTGKDHLAAAMLYQAAGRFGVPCKWVNGQDVFGSFRDRIDTKQADERFIRELCEPQVLAISDPISAVGEVGNWDVGNLYRILNRRYHALKSTWVTMNALSVEDADAKLSAAVFDRLQEDAEVFACFWPSHRERGRK